MRSLLFAVLLAGVLASSACEDASEPDPSNGQKGPNESAPPNIVLVVLDTVRRDATGLVENGNSATPTLDALAAQGTRFVNAWSVAPWTVPSHASMFTGLLPSEHGSTAKNLELARNLPTIAGLLYKRGYETAAFFSNPWLADRVGALLRGFIVQAESPATPTEQAHPPAVAEQPQDQGGRLTLEKLTRWADRRKPERPFLLFVNFLEAHLPYAPPPDIRKQFLADLPRDSIRSTAWGTRVNAGELPQNASDWELTRRLYDASVRHSDQLLKQLLEVLRERQMLDNTVLIITSDHGENLGEHGLSEHQFSLHETLLAVPLVIVAPQARLARGTRRDPVMLTDLFPTIASLTGIELTGLQPPRAHAMNLLDSALTDAAKGDRALVAEYSPPSEALVGELKRRNPELDLTPFRRGFRSVRVADLRLTLSSDGEAILNDLREDPGQQIDRAAERPDEVAALRRTFAELSRISHRADEAAPASRLDPETRKQLRALGYFE